MIDPGLKGRIALVTGGNNPHGIGAAVAKALAEQGAMVFIHYFRQEAAAPQSDEPDAPGLDLYYAMQSRSADKVVQAIRDAGGRAECWEADLHNPAAVPRLFDGAEETFGPVEILVNNAADYEADTFMPQKLLEQGEQHLWEEGPRTSTIHAASHERNFGVNTRAAALAMAEFAKRHALHELSWGRVVNISADCSQGSPAEVSYRASKYALESYSRSAAAELGPLGITVNVVSPGPIQTGYISREAEKELIKSIPLGRVGLPEDISAAVIFLASEQAGWITGQLVTVHGGHRMSLGM
jgi:3-oxoacyl-[acyl-carrier protein] reductase